MEKIQLFIESLSYSQTHDNAFALILRENNGDGKLPIVIGPFEAQAIAVAIDSDLSFPRPLTHDLMQNVFEGFEIELEEVLIYAYIDNLFYSKLIFKDGQKIDFLDCRTSDAVALAIRADVPIFTYDFILRNTQQLIAQTKEIESDNKNEIQEEQIGELDIENQLKSIIEESRKSIDESTAEGSESKEELIKKKIAHLENELRNAVAAEDFEKAVKLRDDIEKLKP